MQEMANEEDGHSWQKYLRDQNTWESFYVLVHKYDHQAHTENLPNTPNIVPSFIQLYMLKISVFY